MIDKPCPGEEFLDDALVLYLTFEVNIERIITTSKEHLICRKLKTANIIGRFIINFRDSLALMRCLLV